MKTYENHGKRWKSLEDKKPAWNRAKVSVWVAGPNLSSLRHPYPEIHENPLKSMKIYRLPL